MGNKDAYNVTFIDGDSIYPIKGEFHSVLLKVTNNGAIISVPVRGFVNSLEGQSLYTRKVEFTFEKVKKALKLLFEEFSMLKNAPLSQLEFGFDVDEFQPQGLIQRNIHLYLNGASSLGYAHNIYEQISEDGSSKVFKRHYFNVEAVAFWQNMLSLNVLVKKRAELQRIGYIQTSHLLEASLLRKLFSYYLKRLKGLVYIDDFEPHKESPFKGVNFMEMLFYKFWDDIHRKESRTSFYNKRKKFFQYIQDKGFTKNKDRFIVECESQFEQFEQNVNIYLPIKEVNVN